MADFAIKAGDLLPVVTGVLTYSDGSSVNLTGCTVTFVLRSQDTATTAVSAPATITNATAGLVTYTWQTGDTATPGRYSAEWQVTSAGKRQTFPTDGYLTVVIEESLSSTALPSRLVSLSAVKADLNIPGSETDQDAELLGFIDAARQVIENIVGPVVPQQKTVFLDGGAADLLLPDRWVISVDSVFENRGLMNYPLTNQPLGASVDAFGYTWDTFTNKIVRRSFGGSTVLFAPGSANIGLTYTAGLNPIPSNIKLAALELVRHWWQWGQQGNTETFGGDADTAPTAPSWGAFALPNRVLELLKPHKRTPAVG